MYRSNVLVCGGTGCTSSNSEQIIEKLNEEIRAQGLEKEVNVIRTGCFGLCALGPIMVVYPEGAFYSRVTPEDVPEIVSEHLLKGRIVKRLLYQETVVDDNTTKSLNETTFYAKQMRIALRNCGVIPQPLSVTRIFSTSSPMSSATSISMSEAPAEIEFCAMSMTLRESSRIRYAVYFARIWSISSGTRRPYTSSLIVITGARPQAPIQRQAVSEKAPSSVHSSG